jgi:hypothetical protein
MELPHVGAKIAALHSSGSFYVGPFEVIDVDAPRLVVTVHPDYWPPKNFIIYRPHRLDANPLKWNLISDLTDAERDGLTKGVFVTLEALRFGDVERPGVEVESHEIAGLDFPLDYEPAIGLEESVAVARLVDDAPLPDLVHAAEIHQLTPPDLPMRAREPLPELDLSNAGEEKLP